MMHPSQPRGISRLIAKGFERVEPVTAEVAAKSHNGMEQRLVIRSCPLAQAGQRGLRTRLAAAVRQLGWRVYVTTQPPDQLPLQEAVLAYRSEYLVERAMGRMKGWSVSLTAMYLERDDHVTGLICLLSLRLRVLTRLEFGVLQRLATAKTTLAGLYVGSPTRATPHLTAEHVLEAFQGLMLTIIQEGRRRRRHLTPLACLHQRLLGLLDFSADTYTRLCTDPRKPP
jgi:transposase